MGGGGRGSGGMWGCGGGLGAPPDPPCPPQAPGGQPQGLGGLQMALSILEKYGQNLLWPSPPGTAAPSASGTPSAVALSMPCRYPKTSRAPIPPYHPNIPCRTPISHQCSSLAPQYFIIGRQPPLITPIFPIEPQ